jgi:hypothetical protein
VVVTTSPTRRLSGVRRRSSRLTLASHSLATFSSTHPRSFSSGSRSTHCTSLWRTRTRTISRTWPALSVTVPVKSPFSPPCSGATGRSSIDATSMPCCLGSSASSVRRARASSLWRREPKYTPSATRPITNSAPSTARTGERFAGAGLGSGYSAGGRSGTSGGGKGTGSGVTPMWRGASGGTGTAVTCPQIGHAAGSPACSSRACNSLPHSQRN